MIMQVSPLWEINVPAGESYWQQERFSRISPKDLTRAAST
jgi:hypothetical protein